MRKSFDEFIASFGPNSCLKNNQTAKDIYDNIIWDTQTRIQMAEASDSNKPALLVCGKAIEDYCMTTPNSTMNLNNDTVKETVGRMVAFSLEPLGYSKKKKVPLPQSCNFTYFTSASIFERTKPGTEKIIKTIIDSKDIM